MRRLRRVLSRNDPGLGCGWFVSTLDFVKQWEKSHLRCNCCKSLA